MLSTTALARGRTAFNELVHPAAMRRARDDAARIWASVYPKLKLSRDMISSKRRTRFVRNILAADLPRPVRYLEIGSFEGSSLTFVHALLKGQVQATAIDPFENYDELRDTDMPNVGARFRANVKAVGVDVRILQGHSVDRLPPLISAGETFDLIYIDGSHAGLDVMTDAVLCWRLLAPHGLMIFDDYRFPECGPAIDAFVALVKSEAIVTDIASQVFLRRRHCWKPAICPGAAG